MSIKLAGDVVRACVRACVCVCARVLRIKNIYPRQQTHPRARRASKTEPTSTGNLSATQMPKSLSKVSYRGVKTIHSWKQACAEPASTPHTHTLHKSYTCWIEMGAADVSKWENQCHDCKTHWDASRNSWNLSMGEMCSFCACRVNKA